MSAGPARLLETAIAACLELDPEWLASLGELEGKVVEVEVTPSGPRARARLAAAGIRFEPWVGDEGAQPPDLAVSGPLPALLELARQGGREDGATIPAGVRVGGDLDTLRALRRHLGRLDPDWEEPLARMLGDAVGHQVARAAAGAARWGAESARTLARDAGEYLVEESRLVPSRHETEAHARAVEDLRDDVERLERRVARLDGEAPS